VDALVMRSLLVEVDGDAVEVEVEVEVEAGEPVRATTE
jgi:hypothetical protein